MSLVQFLFNRLSGAVCQKILNVCIAIFFNERKLYINKAFLFNKFGSGYANQFSKNVRAHFAFEKYNENEEYLAKIREYSYP